MVFCLKIEVFFGCECFYNKSRIKLGTEIIIFFWKNLGKFADQNAEFKVICLKNRVIIKKIGQIVR